MGCSTEFDFFLSLSATSLFLCSVFGQHFMTLQSSVIHFIETFPFLKEFAVSLASQKKCWLFSGHHHKYRQDFLAFFRTFFQSPCLREDSYVGPLQQACDLES